MILVLCRHAARDSFSSDNGLSELGRSQSSELGEKLRKYDGVAPPLKILTSPKRRCVETATLVSKKLGVTPIVEMKLDEARNNESMGAFTGRIGDFFLELKLVSDATLIVMSHSDWLEEAGYYLFQGRPSLRWSHAGAHVVEYTSQGTRYLVQL